MLITGTIKSSVRPKLNTREGDSAQRAPRIFPHSWLEVRLYQEVPEALGPLLLVRRPVLATTLNPKQRSLLTEVGRARSSTRERFRYPIIILMPGVVCYWMGRYPMTERMHWNLLWFQLEHLGPI